SAQQLREETRTQATREAELVLREARAEAERIVGAAQGEVSGASDAVRRIQAQRAWFLRAFRAFVERQLVEIEQEEERLRELQRREGQPPTPSPVPAREEEAGIPPWLSTLDDEPEEDS
ncbi:MAG: DivIVA domain-containing protein, partial [Longimicrobiaceae bacterium]